MKLKHKIHGSDILRNRTFRKGYLDGLSAFSFVVFSDSVSGAKIPTLDDIWRDVGITMEGAIADFASEKSVKRKYIVKR